VHEEPSRALSDGATSWPLADLDALLRAVLAIDRAARSGRGAWTAFAEGATPGRS
jgi:3-deoxy-D-manno-octulosonic acid (KDO) 8-phosphate synthase